MFSAAFQSCNWSSTALSLLPHNKSTPRAVTRCCTQTQLPPACPSWTPWRSVEEEQVMLDFTVPPIIALVLPEGPPARRVTVSAHYLTTKIDFSGFFTHYTVNFFYRYEIDQLYIKVGICLTWPRMFMTTTVLEWLHTTKCSGCWGRGITLLTGTSDARDTDLWVWTHSQDFVFQILNITKYTNMRDVNRAVYQ